MTAIMDPLAEEGELFMPRIAIAGFQHETNTFGATNATFADFELADGWPGLLTGAETITGTAGINLPLAGFAAAAGADSDVELVPILWCAAEPSAQVTDDAFERIAGMLLDGLRGERLDGIYLDLHGAMVTQSHDDGEGELLSRIRALVGDDLPVAVTLDLHANVTEAMVRHASSLTIFRTYPHLDMAQSGHRAYGVLRHLIGAGPYAKAFRQVPFLIPLTAQYTGADPCRSLYAALADLPPEPAVFGDIAMGFPAADIADVGASVVAYAPSQDQADRIADQMLARIIAAEPDFDARLMTAPEAVAAAMREPAGKPVVIADVQDNPGAGGTSDTTGLLSALIEGGATGAVFALVNDPEIAALAHAEGTGATIEALLGGKSGLPGQVPYAGRFAVEALSDGRFAFTGEMYAGSVAELGPMAVLRVLDPGADVRVIVSSKRSQCLDQAIFTHIGVDPTAERILAIKSTVHFRADFEPIAGCILNAEAPGTNLCRLESIPYKNLRPGLRIGPGQGVRERSGY